MEFEPEPEEIAEPAEPIRLFDRRKTRQLRAASPPDDAVAQNGLETPASNGKSDPDAELSDSEVEQLLEELIHESQPSQNGALEVEGQVFIEADEAAASERA